MLPRNASTKALYTGLTRSIGPLWNRKLVIPHIELVDYYGDGRDYRTALKVQVGQHIHWLMDISGVDMISAYRTLKAVELGWNFWEDEDYRYYLPSIDDVELHPESADRWSAHHKFKNLFGERIFETIFTCSIPEEIVDIAVEIKESIPQARFTSRWKFTEAVEFGLLSWSGKLEKLGVQKPDRYGEYEKYLRMYARDARLARNCVGMWSIERFLQEALDHGFETTYGEANTMAFSIAAGKADSAMFGMGIASMVFGDPGISPDQFLAKEEKEHIPYAVHWVASNTILGTPDVETVTEMVNQAKYW